MSLITGATVLAAEYARLYQTTLALEAKLNLLSSAVCGRWSFSHICPTGLAALPVRHQLTRAPDGTGTLQVS